MGPFFGLLSRHQPHRTEGLRILARTRAMPGLPLIAGGTASDADIRGMKRGLREAFEYPALENVRNRLGLKAIRFTEMAEYGRLSAALERLDEQRIPPLL